MFGGESKRKWDHHTWDLLLNDCVQFELLPQMRYQLLPSISLILCPKELGKVTR
ncbi:unnamed protein product [Gongylonema pulchrum]|uniref:Uncharacterized protein n=1 Tax=Gongylonema pulchrum TaxID=637853 RepID=A0A183DGK6_9BILA|nr:unnamed protein product [Gongylonema pulchrum]